MGCFTNLDFWGRICSIITFCVAVCFIILCIPYIITIAKAAEAGQVVGTNPTVAIILWVLSILILLCIAGCGIYGACKQHIKCLMIFFLVNLINWVFTILQLILFYVAYSLCGTGDPYVGPDSMFGSICYNVDDLWFWIPSVIGGGVNACGAFVACSLRWKIMHTGSDGKKAMGEYFG